MNSFRIFPPTHTPRSHTLLRLLQSLKAPTSAANRRCTSSMASISAPSKVQYQYTILDGVEDIDSWSLDEIYRQRSHPRQEEVFSVPGKGPGIHARKCLVQPTSFSRVEPKHFSQDMVLVDLGEAFLSPSPPPKGVGTPNKHASPELLLESTNGRTSGPSAAQCSRCGLAFLCLNRGWGTTAMC